MERDTNTQDRAPLPTAANVTVRGRRLRDPRGEGVPMSWMKVGARRLVVRTVASTPYEVFRSDVDEVVLEREHAPFGSRTVAHVRLRDGRWWPVWFTPARPEELRGALEAAGWPVSDAGPPR